MRRIAVLAALAAIMLVDLMPTAATAAFPGSNGRLAFWDFVGQPPQIFTIDPDGTGRVRLTNTANALNSDPAWSADGSRIAFTRYSVGSGKNSLRLMDADGSNVSIVLNLDDLPSGFVFISDPAWSPDGSMLAFCAFREPAFENKVFTVGTDGMSLAKLSGADDDDCSPAWSPDGATIAVDSIDEEFRGDIVLLAADGSTRTPILTAGDTKDPNWDPTGAELAFSRRTNKRTDVYTANADGSGLTQVTHTVLRWEFAPVWSPDGTRIAFSRTGGTNSLTIQDLWTIAPDGTDPDRVTNSQGVDELAPDWQPV
jgi:Tol biopolymer transport system component